MGSFTLTDTTIFAGALDASCFGSSVTGDAGVDLVKSTTFCSGGWDTYVPVNKGWTLALQGPQDLAISTAATTYGPDEHYALNLGTAYPVSLVPSGGAEGNVAYFSEGRLAGYAPLQGGTTSLAEHSTSWLQTRYPLVRGVFATEITISATGGASGTGHNLGAVSATQRVYASLHFLTAGGTTPSVSGFLQSDDNAGFTSPTNRIVFTPATTRTSEFLSLAGPITDTYWRFLFTTTGTSPSVQVRGFIGIQ